MDKNTYSNNPWKGLQSYQENDVIYGRDEEIKNLYTHVFYNTQTVVYGKSGIGKSSIINAGIIPRAKLDGMLPISIRFAHTTKKEQVETAPYVEQILQRIREEVEKNGATLEDVAKSGCDTRLQCAPNMVEPNPKSLWELLHRYRIWIGEGDNRRRLIPLLLFDQFEEIFTIEVDRKRVVAFFKELADLLNEIKPDYLFQTKSEDNQMPTCDQNEEDGIEEQRNVFSRIVNRKRTTSVEYLEKSDFHLVITLREDFLSYLERYTVYIPTMKLNRFPILPLNEEQAAKIIMEPVKGLVDETVAVEIIQRITGKDDFLLNGIPEIEVDAALLSLYMEQLYNKKKGDDTVITSELVLKYSDDIIKKFYEESVCGISETSINILEKELITNANRRNNVARVDLLTMGVDEDELDSLIQKKILREFSYGGDLRIEFIHDILCDIVIERVEHREQLDREKEMLKAVEEEKKRREKERQIQEEKLKKAEEEKRLLIREQKLQEEENRLKLKEQEAEAEKEKKELENKAIAERRALKRKTFGMMFVFLLIVSFIVVFLVKELQNKNKLLGADQQFFISLSEDSLVVADNDYWKASLRVTAISDSSETCILDTLINKSTVNNSYSFSSSSAKKFKIDIDYGDNSRYEKISQSYTIGQLTESPSIPLIIKFAERPLYTYESNIVMDFNGVCKNIQDAVVILRDKVQRTDENGHFCFNMEAQIPKDAVFYVVKDGFNVESFELSSDLKLRDKYTLTPSDSLSRFFESVSKWVEVENDSFEYRFPGIVVYNDGRRDSIYFLGKNIDSKSLKDKLEIEGYYYFRSEYSKYVKNHKDYLSCHFFKGKLDKRTDENGFRYFEVTSTDVANNRQILYGKMKERDKKDPKSSREYTGEIKSSTGIIGVFETYRKQHFPKIQDNYRLDYHLLQANP